LKQFFNQGALNRAGIKAFYQLFPGRALKRAVGGGGSKADSGKAEEKRLRNGDSSGS
jgi:hypothetical protein